LALTANWTYNMKALQEVLNLHILVIKHSPKVFRSSCITSREFVSSWNTHACLTSIQSSKCTWVHPKLVHTMLINANESNAQTEYGMLLSVHNYHYFCRILLKKFYWMPSSLRCQQGVAQPYPIANVLSGQLQGYAPAALLQHHSVETWKNSLGELLRSSVRNNPSWSVLASGTKILPIEIINNLWVREQVCKHTLIKNAKSTTRADM
jgi:hypothetical protein